MLAIRQLICLLCHCSDTDNNKKIVFEHGDVDQFCDRHFREGWRYVGKKED